jgi:ABC-type transporter MlaC component
MNKKELDDLKNELDQIHLQLTHLTVKQGTILSMILGVYHETLPSKNSQQIVGNFCKTLERNLNDAYSDLEGQDIIFDHSAILRAKFEVLGEIQHLKQTFG